MEVALDFFILRVRKSRSKGLLKLDDLDGAGLKLLDVISQSLAPLIAGNYKGTPGKSLWMTVSKTTATEIEGSLTVGNYGLASSVMDVTKGAKAFDMDKHHAVQMPYYFRVYIPKAAENGVLILQRLGVNGVTSIIKPILRDHFATKLDKHTLDVAAMVPEYVFQRYLKSGTPKAVTFVKHSIPADRADKVSGKHKEAKGRVEVTYKSSDPSFFQIARFAKAKSAEEMMDIYTFDDFEPDQIKMKVDIAGHTRTINLNNHAKLRASFDISDQVGELPSGHPNPDDIRKAANAILKEVAPAAGVAL